MCRCLDIVCTFIQKHSKDPVVLETVLNILETYARNTDNTLDDDIVDMIREKLNIHTTHESSTPVDSSTNT